MTYITNDRLKFTLQKERHLPMIEEGDEDTKNKKEGPLRVHRLYLNR